MRLTIACLLVLTMAAGASAQQVRTYGWEDGMATAIGTYGNVGLMEVVTDVVHTGTYAGPGQASAAGAPSPSATDLAASPNSGAEQTMSVSVGSSQSGYLGSSVTTVVPQRRVCRDDRAAWLARR